MYLCSLCIGAISTDAPLVIQINTVILHMYTGYIIKRSNTSLKCALRWHIGGIVSVQAVCGP